jgi:alpha-glucosidase
MKGWRRIADEYRPPRLLLGETYVFDIERMASYYGSGQDELDLAFNFSFVFSPFESAALREVAEKTYATIPPEAAPVWTGSNHDAGRFPTRWCDGNEAKIRCALVILLGLAGTPVLYYGDELGMGEIEIPPSRMRDPVGRLHWPNDVGRDRGRTPMPWSDGPLGGFTTAADPWLPVGDVTRNVQRQRADSDSTLAFCRELIALRRGSKDLQEGAYRTLPAPDGIWAWRRGAGTAVAVNLSDRAGRVDLDGEVALASRRDRDGEAVSRSLALDPWDAVVVQLPS